MTRYDDLAAVIDPAKRADWTPASKARRNAARRARRKAGAVTLQEHAAGPGGKKSEKSGLGPVFLYITVPLT